MKEFPQNTPKIEKVIEKPKIKEGVDFVFEQNPELEKIGTKEQYSEYIDTIFPESKLKDIVYHGARSKFEGFDLENHKSTGNFGIGIYTTPDKSWAQKYTGIEGSLYGVILNTKDPFISSLKYKEYYGGHTFSPDIKMSEYINNDSIINYEGLDRNNLKLLNDYLLEYTGSKNELGLPEYQTEVFSQPYIKEIVVFNNQQTHILGTQKDLQKFKEFVERKNVDSPTSTLLP